MKNVSQTSDRDAQQENQSSMQSIEVWDTDQPATPIQMQYLATAEI